MFCVWVTCGAVCTCWIRIDLKLKIRVSQVDLGWQLLSTCHISPLECISSTLMSLITCLHVVEYICNCNLHSANATNTIMCPDYHVNLCLSCARVMHFSSAFHLLCPCALMAGNPNLVKLRNSAWHTTLYGHMGNVTRSYPHSAHVLMRSWCTV